MSRRKGYEEMMAELRVRDREEYRAQMEDIAKGQKIKDIEMEIRNAEYERNSRSANRLKRELASLKNDRDQQPSSSHRRRSSRGPRDSSLPRASVDNRGPYDHRSGASGNGGRSHQYSQPQRSPTPPPPRVRRTRIRTYAVNPDSGHNYPASGPRQGERGNIRVVHSDEESDSDLEERKRQWKAHQQTLREEREEREKIEQREREQRESEQLEREERQKRRARGNESKKQILAAEYHQLLEERNSFAARWDILRAQGRGDSKEGKSLQAEMRRRDPRLNSLEEELLNLGVRPGEDI
ncbi:hypothetical protein N7462_001339 [Penicillium macrosclerotiorum]|uniref:uncharacterized protein n=1 Tax=Penicillium macrosclerotiorum TaxID=303699 RepID=UPI002547D377|nr:uncharacterized protein N7462_001339 [Penicillium macrosclerotiorum]KAJ5691916.1 hypothetical protein N7462_001339 [Penicillium macrosclerotiorum]